MHLFLHGLYSITAAVSIVIVSLSMFICFHVTSEQAKCRYLLLKIRDIIPNRCGGRREDI